MNKQIEIVVVFIALLFLGCENKSERENVLKSNSSVSVQDFQELMSTAGAEHNRCLDYVYAHIVASDSNHLEERVRALANEYVSGSDFFSGEIEKSLMCLNGRFPDCDNSSNLWFDENDHYLSGKQKQILRTIDSIIDGSDNLQIIKQQIQTFTATICYSGTDDEKYIAIVASEIAKASLSYWYENQYKWEMIFDSQSKGKWINWKTVGKEDVKGAIVGATVVGAAASVTGPPGWAAGATAVAGTAVGASLAEATDQIWEHLFGE